MICLSPADVGKRVIPDTDFESGTIVEYKNRANGKNFLVRFPRGRQYWFDKFGKYKSGRKFYLIIISKQLSDVKEKDKYKYEN